MRLYEFEGTDLFRREGIPVPHFALAASPEEAQRIMMEQVQAGNTPSWLMKACLLLFAVFGLWAAGVGCGIAALRKPTRRAWAIVARVLSGVLPLLLCIGVASGLSGGLGG